MILLITPQCQTLIPGFQCKEPTTYRFEEMPAMDVDEFIASW